MNIMNKVTWKCMKQNKKRTIVTILGVIICVAMISAVCVIASSLQVSLIEASEKQNGTYELIVSGISKEETDKLKQDAAFQTAARLAIISQSSPIGETTKKTVIATTEFDHMELFAMTMVKGKLPQNANEIMIPVNLYENQAFSYQIGDQLTLPIGEETNVEQSDGTTEYQFLKQSEHTFIITGVYDPSMGALSQSSMMDQYALVTTQAEGLSRAPEYAVYASMKRSVDFFEEYRRIQTEYHIGQTNRNSALHTSLLMYKGISNSIILTTLIHVCVFLGIIILIGGVSLIYNAFSISLSERSRYLGMLSSIGATSKQKRNSVFFEAAIIGIVAIPLGLLSGIAGIAMTFLLINPMIENVFEMGVELTVSINQWCILIPILFSVCVLLLSAWIPSWKASRITAISAIRQNGDFKIRKRDIRTSKLTRKLFGIEAELGLKNTKRNHSRYLATLFSLIICIVLFMSASYFSTAMKNSVTMTQKSSDADFIVDFYSTLEGKVVPEQTIKQLETVKAAQSHTMFSTEKLNFAKELPFSEEARSFIEAYKQFNQISQEDFKTYYYPSLTLQVLDDDAFRTYCKEAGIKESIVKQAHPSVILVNDRTTKLPNQDVYSNISWLNVKQGDHLDFIGYKQGKDDINHQPLYLEIAALTDVIPSINTGYSPEIELIAVTNMENLKQLNEELYAQDCRAVADFYEIQYQSKDTEALSKEIVSIIDNSDEVTASYQDIGAQHRKEEQRYIMLSIFLYGFVTLILLICMANIINTISTSVSLRKREFAMIKSVGITPGKFHKMIAYETLFYGIKAILYGIPLGLLVMLWMNFIFAYSFRFDFAFPWINIVGIILGVFLILGVTMSYAICKIRNDNIVETIRNESI